MPYPRRRERHFEIGDAEWPQRIENRADDRGGCCDRSCLAAALGAERIMRAWLALIELRNEDRKMMCARYLLTVVAGYGLAPAIRVFR